jgi:hypothetical protein
MNGVFFNPNRSLNARGRTFSDAPHQVQVQGTYFSPVLYGVRVSGGYRYVSGGAWSRTAVITGLSQGNQTVRIEPRGARRNEAITQFDLRLEKTFPLRASGQSIGLYADVFNVTNQGVALSVVEASGDTFGQPATWTAPRTLQVAARLMF